MNKIEMINLALTFPLCVAQVLHLDSAIERHVRNLRAALVQLAPANLLGRCRRPFSRGRCMQTCSRLVEGVRTYAKVGEEGVGLGLAG